MVLVQLPETQISIHPMPVTQLHPFITPQMEHLVKGMYPDVSFFTDFYSCLYSIHTCTLRGGRFFVVEIVERRAGDNWLYFPFYLLSVPQEKHEAHGHLVLFRNFGVRTLPNVNLVFCWESVRSLIKFFHLTRWSSANVSLCAQVRAYVVRRKLLAYSRCDTANTTSKH
jgi:hypothetical protein